MKFQINFGNETQLLELENPTIQVIKEFVQQKFTLICKEFLLECNNVYNEPMTLIFQEDLQKIEDKGHPIIINVLNQQEDTKKTTYKQYLLIKKEPLVNHASVDFAAQSRDNKYILIGFNNQQSNIQTCTLFKNSHETYFLNIQTDYDTQNQQIVDALFLKNNQFLLSIQKTEYFLDIFSIQDNSWSLVNRLHTSKDSCKYLLSHDENFLYVFEKHLFYVWKYIEPNYQQISVSQIQIDQCEDLSLSKSGNQIVVLNNDLKLFILQKRNQKWTLQKINYFVLQEWCQYVSFLNDDILVVPDYYIRWNHWRNKKISRIQTKTSVTFNRNYQFSYVFDQEQQIISIYEMKNFKSKQFQQIKLNGLLNLIQVSQNGRILIIIDREINIFKLIM